MNGHPGRLVENHQVIVGMNDRQLLAAHAGVTGTAPGCLFARANCMSTNASPRCANRSVSSVGAWVRRHAQRRNSDPVAGSETTFGIGPAAVDPHLAAADQAVHMRFGDAATNAKQKVVESLPVMVFIDGDRRGGGDSYPGVGA